MILLVIYFFDFYLLVFSSPSPSQHDYSRVNYNNQPTTPNSISNAVQNFLNQRPWPRQSDNYGDPNYGYGGSWDNSWASPPPGVPPPAAHSKYDSREDVDKEINDQIQDFINGRFLPRPPPSTNVGCKFLLVHKTYS